LIKVNSSNSRTRSLAQLYLITLFLKAINVCLYDNKKTLINLEKKIMKGSKKRMFTSVIKNAIILLKNSKTWMKLNKIIS